MARQTKDAATLSVEAARKRALATLQELGGSTTTEDDIIFEGKKVVLPATFNGDLNKVIDFLREKRDEEEQNIEYSRTFRYRPLDGAVAMARAIKDIFGITLGKPIPTPWGMQPPTLIDVEVGVGETIQAPWGGMAIPGLPGLTVYSDDSYDAELGRIYHVWGEGPKKYRFAVEGLFRAIEHQLQVGSIYKGKAITGAETPGFLDLSSIDPDSVIYRRSVIDQLDANVWTPIEKADQLADLGEPGKRAVIFSGPYGTGKTLGAYLTAQRAVESGWTFLMARPGRDDLQQVIATARMYQPAVVFTEDLDTVASANSGSVQHMSKMLDLFDGLDTKGLRLMLVLTTNNVDTLHPAMLRPGRLDAVIRIHELDQEGIERLARYVFGDKLAANVDWELVAKANSDYTPAFVREGFGRVVRYQVGRGSTSEVTTEDLVGAAEGLRDQYELMMAAQAEPEQGQTFKDFVGEAVVEAVDGVKLVRTGHDGPWASLKATEDHRPR